MSQNRLTTATDEEYSDIPVSPGGTVHNGIGFCYDMAHECHKDVDSIAVLRQAIQDGELTMEDANNIYRGKTV